MNGSDDAVAFSKRLVVPSSLSMVVLDTSAVRQLVHEPDVTWDECFTEMASDGYSFSLGEVAVFELIAQVQRGSISAEDHKTLIHRIERFLNPEARVIPAYHDVMGMIGAELVDEFETRTLIAMMWAMLKACSCSDSYLPISIEKSRDEEVDEWASFLERVIEHVYCSGLDVSKARPEIAAEALAVSASDSLDARASCFPGMSVRQHLEVRYRFRQAVRSKLKKEPYRPRSEKRKNDAMDLSMYSYLTLPAFVVTRDKGFFSKISSIDSFQRDWFKFPEDLAASWMRGERPAPRWPDANWITKEKQRSFLKFLIPKASAKEKDC